jgi:serine/threonine protein kinase
MIGKGSFGEVYLAKNIKADVLCAVKVIKKKTIEKHQILVELMHGELKVLEESVSIYIFMLLYRHILIS